MMIDHPVTFVRTQSTESKFLELDVTTRTAARVLRAFGVLVYVLVPKSPKQLLWLVIEHGTLGVYRDDALADVTSESDDAAVENALDEAFDGFDLNDFLDWRAARQVDVRTGRTGVGAQEVVSVDASAYRTTSAGLAFLSHRALDGSKLRVAIAVAAGTRMEGTAVAVASWALPTALMMGWIELDQPGAELEVGVNG